MNQRVWTLAAAVVLALSAIGTVQAQELAYGITGAIGGVNLVRFNTATPGTITSVGPLTGILPGHFVRAIDFRPSTGGLYALSTNAAGAATVGQLYYVDLDTAALTPIGTTFAFGADPGTRVSMDFNPVVDRIRVTSGFNSLNLRLHPDTGALIAIDTPLAYAPGDPNVGNNPPLVVGVAYNNNFAGATSSTMFVWDFNLDVLSSLTNPNTGQMSTIGGPASFITADGGVGFDISGATGIAYFSYQEDPSGVETLGIVNLNTGLVTNIGAFGGGVDMLDISIAIVPEPTTIALSTIGLGGVLVASRRRLRLRRRGGR
jgi:hypothetical protein